MNLFLLRNDGTVKQILQDPVYQEGRDLILCFNYLVYLQMEKQGGAHNFRLIEEMFIPSDYDLMHCATDRIAKNWYKINGQDQTVFQGLSYGELLEVMFSRTYQASIAVKYGEILRKALESHDGIKRIYSDFKNIGGAKEDFFSIQALMTQISNQWKVEIVNLETQEQIPVSIFTNRGDYDLPKINVQQSLRNRLKDSFKFITNLITNIRLKFRAVFNQRNIYFFNYLNLNELLKHNLQHLFISDIPVRFLKLDMLFSGLTFLDFQRIKYTISQKEIDFLEDLRRNYGKDGQCHQYDGDFIINGVDYRVIYLPIIKDMVSNIVPGLLKHAFQLTNGMKKYNITDVIIHDCLDETNRVVLEVCRKEGIKTFFVDHGIQGHAMVQKAVEQLKPYELITAGTFNPYEGMKFIPLGNPCMDPYPASKRKRVTAIKKVLFLSFEDNFYARLDRWIYQEKYYSEIFGSFKDLSCAGIKIYYRPHADNRDYHDYLTRFFGVDPAIFSYACDGAFDERIKEMDLLVTNISTCFFEAQAAGVPTIFMDPGYKKGSVLLPFDGIHGQELLRATNKKELLDLILPNQQDPAYLNLFLERFLHKYALLYMGELDGLASKRIMDYICTKDVL